MGTAHDVDLRPFDVVPPGTARRTRRAAVLADHATCGHRPGLRLGRGWASAVPGEYQRRSVHERTGGHDGDVVSACLSVPSPALDLQDGFGDRIHAVQIALAEQAAVGVHRQRSVRAGPAGREQGTLYRAINRNWHADLPYCLP